MIHYSSIKDAWGKKDMFKNNTPLSKSFEPASNCNTQVNKPTTQSETFTQNNTIKYEVPQVVQPQVVQQIQQTLNEHFAQNNCGFMEHIQNCPFCMGKMKEHFAETSTGVLPEQPISIVNIFGFKINITKDVLKVLFIIILIVIFILLLRIINVSFKKNNTSNTELLKLMTQIKYLNPMISQL